LRREIHRRSVIALRERRGRRFQNRLRQREQRCPRWREGRRPRVIQRDFHLRGIRRGVGLGREPAQLHLRAGRLLRRLLQDPGLVALLGAQVAQLAFAKGESLAQAGHFCAAILAHAQTGALTGATTTGAGGEGGGNGGGVAQPPISKPRSPTMARIEVPRPWTRPFGIASLRASRGTSPKTIFASSWLRGPGVDGSFASGDPLGRCSPLESPRVASNSP